MRNEEIWNSCSLYLCSRFRHGHLRRVYQHLPIILFAGNQSFPPGKKNLSFMGLTIALSTSVFACLSLSTHSLELFAEYKRLAINRLCFHWFGCVRVTNCNIIITWMVFIRIQKKNRGRRKVRKMKEMKSLLQGLMG